MKTRTEKNITLICLILGLLMLWGCGSNTGTPSSNDPGSGPEAVISENVSEPPEPAKDSDTTEEDPAEAAPEGTGTETEEPADTAATEKNGEIYVLFTSDVHCGVNQGFGYAGLKQIRDSLENKGYDTLLVDDGDAIQGELIGILSRGDAIIDLMNDLAYDVAIPGNHEFDYGMDRFLELTEKASFPYISCNFRKDGDLVLKPYVIKTVGDKKIGFVGVTTPSTITDSTPKYFQDDQGNFIYDFCQDADGTALYEAVQKAVDDARGDGADLIYVMGHVGMDAESKPWTYADIIAHTSGIDVFLDGHSHDTEQFIMKDLKGKEVTRQAVGTRLNMVGYSHILSDGTIEETGSWSWPNEVSAPELLNIDNEITKKIADAMDEEAKEMSRVVGFAEADLTIYDPKELDTSGQPVRMIRRAETNLGDLCADACRDQAGADIALLNGGGIKTDIPKGDITYGDLISVHPYGNSLCVLELTGQQILDVLEWGSKDVPVESGGFLQVSGLTYEIDADVKSPCLKDENSMFAGIRGDRRVKNVMVGGEPIDPKKPYTVAGYDFMMLKNGDGYTMFDGAPLLQDQVKPDSQVLIDYITGTLGGVIGKEYSDPYGEGRILITE